MKFDLDPSLSRVMLIGLCIFLETLLGAVIIQMQEVGKVPDLDSLVLILMVAALQLVTYVATFLRKDSFPE